MTPHRPPAEEGGGPPSPDDEGLRASPPVVARSCRRPHAITWEERKKGHHDWVRRWIPDGKLGLTEDDAEIWIWAWPELLGWPAPVHWLFPFVTGKGKRGDKSWHGPGVLWGLDADGELLIVEAKKCGGGERPDPLEAFLDLDDPLGGMHYADDNQRTQHELGRTIDAPALHQAWEVALAQERSYHGRFGANLQAGRLPPGHSRRQKSHPFPGLINYSCMRRTAFRWRHLYLGPIAGRFLSRGYERDVQAALEQRTRRGNRAPHYVGLLMVAPQVGPRLSGKGVRHLARLRALAGADRVHVRALRARVGAGEQVRVSAWSPDDEQLDRSGWWPGDDGPFK